MVLQWVPHKAFLLHNQVTYSVKVTDCAGCIAIDDVVVTALPAITATAAASAINCTSGATTTTLTVTASGGTGALQYSLNGGTYQPGKTFTVAAGTYTVTVRDARNCTINTKAITVASCGPVDVTKCYSLKNRNSNLFLNISGASTVSGMKAVQNTATGGQSQKFKFTLVQIAGSANYYKIINVNSNLALGVDGGSTIDNKQIKQTTYTGADYQKWSITVSGSYLVFKSKHCGKSMSVLNNSTANGADVVQKTTGGNSEQWTITIVNCSAYAARASQPIAASVSS